jgi:hypothetical protein
MAFIPDNVKPDMDRESDAKTYSRGETVCKFWTGETLTLHNYVNDSYI